MEKTGSRNGWIDLWRFLASLCVICVHFNDQVRAIDLWPFTTQLMPGGYLWVEFFFIVAGYYAIAHVSRWPQGEAPERKIGAYMWKKYKFFLAVAGPYVVLEYVSNNAWAHLDIVGWIRICLSMPTEVLLLKGTNANPYSIAIAMWFLSSLLIAMPIVLLLATRFSGAFKNYLVWLLAPVCYGFVLRKHMMLGSVSPPEGFLRAMAGLCLGAGLYYITEALHRYTFTKRARVLLTVCEVGAMLGAFSLAAVDFIPADSRDMGFVQLVAVSLGITFLGQSGTSRIKSRVLTYLGKLSFPLYCWHSLVIEQVENIAMRVPMSVAQQRIAVFVCSILVACFVLWFVEKVLPRLGKALGTFLIEAKQA